MSAVTKIEWTDRSWNPVRGCSVISPGCVNCYAMKQAHRFTGGWAAGLTKQTKAGPQWTGKVVTVESALLEPLSWRKPQRVFVNSMSDLFHEDVPDTFILAVFLTMEKAKRHTFQILTKRAERMRDVMAWLGRKWRDTGDDFRSGGDPWPLPNVWLGVSVEDQQRAEERIPLLSETPAAVRFISAEPLLGPLDLSKFLHPSLTGTAQAVCNDFDWLIVGGESGPGARRFDVAWARSIVQQCKGAGVACFVKQIGTNPLDMERSELIDTEDRKGGDPSEWPAEIRVREFPAVRS